MKKGLHRLTGGKARRQVMFTVVLTCPETGPCMPFLFPGPSPGQALAFGYYFGYYIQRSDRIHIQGTSLALSRVEGAPHKFTPMPGVHNRMH
jgi:hypothetical protein